MATTLLSFAALLSASVVVAAHEDLRFTPISDPFLGRVVATRSEVRDLVEDTLRSTFRADTEERLKAIQNEMRPMFTALPKTEFGLLSGASTRYLLYRHFLRSRAWVVFGLAPDGEFWNASSPLEPLRQSSHSSVADLFEQRLQSRGLDLSEVALLAAMVENKLHRVSVEHLRKVWMSLRAPNTTTLKAEDIERALTGYILSFMELPFTDSSNIEQVWRWIDSMKTPSETWQMTQRFIEQTVARHMPPHGQEVTFADAERMVVEVSERYGMYQEEDCQRMKRNLLAIEGGRPGRVPLGNFYKAHLGGVQEFTESVDYMRAAGMLDESPSGTPSVLIANYLTSPSQLVLESKEYAVTCVNECEFLLAAIEKEVAASHASPALLRTVIGRLATETTPARLDGLSVDLVDHLQGIADAHGGIVPLHGRLFALWLHRAYPRECPYPFRVGTSKPLTQKEFSEGTGMKAILSMDEIRLLVAPSASFDSGLSRQLESEGLPWDDAEELVAPHMKQRERTVAAVIAPSLGYAAILTVLALLLPNLSILQCLFESSSSARFLKIADRGKPLINLI